MAFILKHQNTIILSFIIIILHCSIIFASDKVFSFPIEKIYKNNQTNNYKQSELLNYKSGILNLLEKTISNNQTENMQFLNQNILSLASSSDENDTKVYIKEITNYFNVQYYGSLYFGSELQELTLIFDTGSSWLWVPTIDCVQCHECTKYDYTESSTYNLLSNETVTITYGTGSVLGLMAEDTVCLYESTDSSTCSLENTILSVYNSQGLDGLAASGILGLAPSNQNTLSELFIDELYNQGIIDQRIFSFYLVSYKNQLYSNTDSRFFVGGYDLSYAIDGEDSTVTWNSLIDSEYWTVKLESAYLGEDYSLNVQFNKAIFDTGTSYILLPTSDFVYLYAYFAQLMPCNYDNQVGLYYCICSEDEYNDAFPNLNIQLANNIYSIEKSSYILKSGAICYFELMTMDFQSNGFWILGGNFLQNYMTIYDMDNEKVGLVGVSITAKVYWSIKDIITFSLLLLFISFIFYTIYKVFIKKDKIEDFVQQDNSQILLEYEEQYNQLFFQQNDNQNNQPNEEVKERHDTQNRN